MTIKLDGRKISTEIYDEIKRGQLYLKENKILAIVTLGDDEASKVYVNNKKKKAVECGYKYMHIQMSDNTNFFELEKMVKMLNENGDVKGIIIQKPLPKELSNWEKQIDEIIDPNKDIDGFHPMSKFNSCTPKGIMTLLDKYNVPYEGKTVVIAGRSKIVAQPLAKMLMDKNCTVTMIHSKTSSDVVRELINNCDIFISAIGKPKYWTKEYFTNNKLALVDVGINRVFDETLNKNVVVGDVDPNCYECFNYYTPVPGGVGLMTVATLIDNLSNS